MIYVNSQNILSAAKKTYLAFYKYRQKELPFDQDLAKELSTTIVVRPNNEPSVIQLIDSKLNYTFNYKPYFPFIKDNLIDFELRFWEADFIKPPRLNQAVSHLKKYPTSRRAIINLWQDTRHKKLNLPAPCSTHIFLRRKDPYLEMHAHLRANNITFLLAMDMQVLSGIQEIAAEKLGLKRGTYIHFVDSLHYYKKDEDVYQKQYQHIIDSDLWQKV